MKSRITRRTFVAAAGGGALVGGGALLGTLAQRPQSLTPHSAKPVVVASANGHKSEDATGLTCVAKAFQRITSGSDVLDALIAGVNIIELDPEETSVGYGGLPNAEGVVQLDASVMHGPSKRGGAVACLEGVRTPSSVAKKVMEETEHHLLVGRDAQDFARTLGFKIEPDLLTERSRALWQEWKQHADRSPFMRSKERTKAWRQAGEKMMAEGKIDAEHFHGTVNCLGLDAKGQVAGVTSTSGLAWKVPGRVGDSPIIGAGLYVDGNVGAAGSTGHGESVMYSLGSFLLVEAMRQGKAPKDAGMIALKRILANTVEKDLLNGRGQPRFNVRFYALNTKGHFAGVSLYEYSAQGKRAQFAFCTKDGPSFALAEPLLPGRPSD